MPEYSWSSPRPFPCAVGKLEDENIGKWKFWKSVDVPEDVNAPLRLRPLASLPNSAVHKNIYSIDPTPFPWEGFIWYAEGLPPLWGLSFQGDCFTTTGLVENAVYGDTTWVMVYGVNVQAPSVKILPQVDAFYPLSQVPLFSKIRFDVSETDIIIFLMSSKFPSLAF